MKISPVFLLRLVVGYVFVFAGISKWLMPDFAVGFEKMGIPYAEFTVLLVGSIELLCGSLLLFHLHIRKAVVPLIVIMLGAVTIAKIPIIVKSGLWKFAHDSRLDFLLLAILIFFWIECADDMPADRR